MILFYLNNQRRFFVGSTYLNGDPCILICDENQKSYGLATRSNTDKVPLGDNEIIVNNPTNSDHMTQFLLVSGVAEISKGYEESGERMVIINPDILDQIDRARERLDSLSTKG